MKDIKKGRGILFWGRRGKKEKKFFFVVFLFDGWFVFC
jgi:hypothetical protein